MSRYPNEQRWDRDRFESYSGPGGTYERDRFEEERDYYQSPPRRAPAAPFAPRPPPVVEERERYARPPPRFYEDEERDSYAQAMVPAGRRERDREYEIDIRTRERYEQPERQPERPSRSFQRPGLTRRPSSLDTYDRKPAPRHPERIREEVIPVPAPPRRRSPPRWRGPPEFTERDYYEDIRIAEPEIYGDEEFRGYREREISRVRRNRSPSTVVEERAEVVEREFPKRGKTKMPARLVERRAIIQLGYPFEEEGNFIIIQRALGKEHIDEVISISREIRAAAPPTLPAPEPVTETRTTYVIEKDGEPPRIETHQGSHAEVEARHGSIASIAKARRSSHHQHHHEHHHSSHHSRGRSSSSSSSSSSTASRTTRKTGRSHSRSTAKVPRSVRDWDDGARSTRRDSRISRQSARSRARARSVSAAPTSRREILLAEERGESSGSLHAGVGALVISPDRDRHRSQKSIKSEIKALEAERKALRYERDADRLRGDAREEIIIERNRHDEPVEVRKDRKGKMSLVH